MEQKKPEKLEIEREDLEEILDKVKAHLSPAQYKILENAIKMLIWLQFVIKEKSISIARLARMLFGKRTESLKNLKGKGNKDRKSGKDSGSEDDQKSSENESDSEGEDGPKDPGNPKDNSADNNPENANNGNPDKPKGKNNGRHPLDDYDVSKITHIALEGLDERQKCPECKKGTLYYWDPEVILVIRGQPPLMGEAYSAQGLRCNLCGKIFRAKFPKSVISQPKADISARAIVCLAKYQLGTPLYRFETWQKLMHLPVSDSEMWEWTESVALAAFPIHQALLKLAAQGEVIHNDDTKGKILDLMAENRLMEQLKGKGLLNSKEQKEFRKGMFTSALLSCIENYQIALYFTGRKNAGENLDELLDYRLKGTDPPIQSCDASTQNRPERHETKVAHCLNHARHNFCELVDIWPNHVLTIVEMFNAAFKNDRETKKMSSEERLKYHQNYSGPVMSKLKNYCNDLLDRKVVEPNSSLGKAVNYLNKHWEGLTLFLRNGDAPMSNNSCERAVKSYVLIRKNSYFYKSCWGAMVGDILLSVIKTCSLNDVNPYDYLIAIQANVDEVEEDPSAWLPWNYTQHTECPFVNVQFKPAEEVYRYSPTGNPEITPVDPQPNFENDKKPLRARAKEFFRHFYPNMSEAFCN